MSKITTIPAGKEIRLSQEIYYYMLMQVPQGRLTRDCDIREYLNELYGASYLPAKGNRTERVLDYKKHLFNFKMASTVNKAVLDQIQREGLRAFL